MADDLQAQQTPQAPQQQPMIYQMMQDPDFGKLAPSEQRKALAAHDPMFAKAGDADIMQFVNAHKTAAAPKETPDSMMSVQDQMARAKNRNYGQTSMSAGTQTYEQAHQQQSKSWLNRFLESAGIPTSQSQTTDMMQNILTPQTSPTAPSVIPGAQRIPVIGSMIRSQDELLKSGHPYGVIPFIGPQMAAGDEQLKNKDYAGAAGSAVNVITQLLGAKSMVERGGVLKKAGTLTEEKPYIPSKHEEAIGSLMDSKAGKVDPIDTAKSVTETMRAEAQKMGVTKSDFKGREGAKLGYKIADKAIETHQDAIDTISKPFMNDKVSMRPIADAIRSEITDDLRNNEPAIAKRLEAEAAKFDRDGTIQEVNDYRIRSNKEQQAYYRKGQSQQIMSEADVSAHVKGANAARDVQYGSIGNRAGIDPAYVRGLFQREGDLIDARNSLNKHYNNASLSQSEAVSQSLREKTLGVQGRASLQDTKAQILKGTLGMKPIDALNSRLSRAFSNNGKINVRNLIGHDYPKTGFTPPPAPGGVPPVGPNRPMLPTGNPPGIPMPPSSLRPQLALPPSSFEDLTLHQPPIDAPTQMRDAARTSGRDVDTGRFKRGYTTSPQTPFDDQPINQYPGTVQHTPFTKPAPDTISQKRFNAIMEDVNNAAARRQSPNEPVTVKDSVFKHIEDAQKAQAQEAAPPVSGGSTSAVENRVKYPDFREAFDKLDKEEQIRGRFINGNTGLPNDKAFAVAEEQGKAKAYAMSDSDGLKAFNDKFGYSAGNELLRAKADALREAGIEAYHTGGDEFSYRGDSAGELKIKLERARSILRDRVFEVKDSDGNTLHLKGVDFSYGAGEDIPTAESELHKHKEAREAAGERKRGELGAITEIKPQNSVNQGAATEERLTQSWQSSAEDAINSGHIPNRPLSTSEMKGYLRIPESVSPQEVIKSGFVKRNDKGLWEIQTKTKQTGQELIDNLKNKGLGTKPKGFKGKATKESGFAAMDLPEALAQGASKLAKTFFSKAQEVAEEKLPNRVLGKSVVPTLINNGVTRAHLDWLGLDDFLKDKNMVTKQEVLDHIRQNDIQVKDTILGSKTVRDVLEEIHPGTEKELKKKGYEFSTKGGETILWRGNKLVEILSDVPNEDKGLVSKFFDADYEHGNGRSPKYKDRKDLQTPGGKNYREMLLSMPEREAPIANKEKWDKYTNLINEQRKIADDTSRPWHEVEAANRKINDLYAQRDVYRAAKSSDINFTGGHYGDIEPNVVAHVRFNDRFIPDENGPSAENGTSGHKTLHLEEVQSDWNQTGRKEGYQSVSQTQKDAAYAKLKAAQDKMNAFMDANGISHDIGTKWSSIPQSIKDEYSRLSDERDFASRDYDKVRFNKAVPDNPFKNNWHELAMKRMLRYAAENGYDRLAWTTGETQNERYDLSKHIDSLTYDRYDNGNYSLVGKKNGKDILVQESIKPNELDNYVGKDVADKIINDKGSVPDGHPRPKSEGYGVLSGLDLKVGGSGMKGFYDKILPDFLNKYGKKWGAKVGQSEISTGEGVTQPKGEEIPESEAKNELTAGKKIVMGMPADNGKYNYTELDKPEQLIYAPRGAVFHRGGAKGKPVHYIDITPSMKKDVLEKGQPISKNVPSNIPPKIRQLMGESA